MSYNEESISLIYARFGEGVKIERIKSGLFSRDVVSWITSHYHVEMLQHILFHGGMSKWA